VAKLKVYWAVSNVLQGNMVSQSLYFDPEPVNNLTVFKDYKTAHKHNNFKLCPSYLDHIENLYALRFPIDYTLDLNGGVRSEQFDRRFFENFVFVREEGVLGFNVRHVMFCEEPLTMSITPAYLEDNDISNNTIVFPGQFDIGRWFRNTDCAFQVKQGVKRLQVQRGDAFNYIRFHTEQQVELVRFEYTPEIAHIHNDILSSKMILGNRSPKLSYYYEIFKQSRWRGKLLRLIRANIL
jgi:hypothetical protein